MQFSGWLGWLYSILDWLTNLSLLNIFFITINSPLIFLFMMLNITPFGLAWGLLILPIFVLSILLLCPSFVAILNTIYKYIFLDDKYLSITKLYFQEYKNNFILGIKSGVIFVPITFMLIFYVSYFLFDNDLIASVFFIVLLLFIVFIWIFYICNVHYNMSVQRKIKIASLLTIGKPVIGLSVILVLFSIAYISWRLWVLGVFFSISVTVYLILVIFLQIVLKLERKQKDMID